MEVTVPITPRRTRALRPLLPPGPGGVDNVSSRGDRYGRHRLCSTRILIALGSNCHPSKRQLAGTFHAGGRAVARLVIRSWGGAVARGAQYARRFGGDRYGPPQGRPLRCELPRHRPSLGVRPWTRRAFAYRRPGASLGNEAWGRGPSARIPGSRVWGRGCGPAARGPGRRPNAVPCSPTSAPGDRRVARSHGFYDQKAVATAVGVAGLPRRPPSP